MNKYKPEVGEECEYSWGRYINWFRCVYHGITKNGKPIIERDGSIIDNQSYSGKAIFRPIRTQEEIEREEAIEAMHELTAYEQVEFDICAKLYDTGYRLVGEKVDVLALRREFNCARNPASNGMTLGDAKWLLANYDIFRKVVK